MAQLPQEDQLAVWVLPTGIISFNAKVVWQYLADVGDDVLWSFESAAAEISDAIKNLDEIEVQAALDELGTIPGALVFPVFTVGVPDALSGNGDDDSDDGAE